MKKLITTLLFSTLLVACSGKGDSVESIISSDNLEKMIAKKSELVKEQIALKTEIDKLSNEIAKRDKRSNAALVTTKALEASPFKHYIEIQGNVETDQNMIIYPEFSGILTQVYVKEGQHVSKGQRLAKIDDGGLSSQLARQEAQTTLAKTTFERQERLWNQKIGSEIQYLEAKTNYDASKAATQQLRSQLSKTLITAPFSGYIDDIIAERGQVVVPGQSPVMRVVNLNDMYVDASVPESYLGKISKGTEVIVDLASLGTEITGTVRQVGNFVNPDNRSFSIKIAIPNKDQMIKPNLIATVRVNDYNAENAIIIPANLIQENAAGESITYIFEPKSDGSGIAKQVKLELGQSYGDQVEITKGLETGQFIIVEGARALRPGQEVTTTTQAK